MSVTAQPFLQAAGVAAAFELGPCCAGKGDARCEGSGEYLHELSVRTCCRGARTSIKQPNQVCFIVRRSLKACTCHRCHDISTALNVSSNNVREELATLNTTTRLLGIVAQLRGLRTSALSLEAFEVKVPQMGESITEGTIATVLKKPGA